MGTSPLDSTSRPWYWYTGNEAEFDFPAGKDNYFLVQINTDPKVVGINRVDYPVAHVIVQISKNGNPVSAVVTQEESQHKVKIDNKPGVYKIKVDTDIPARVHVSAYSGV